MGLYFGLNRMFLVKPSKKPVIKLELYSRTFDEALGDNHCVTHMRDRNDLQEYLFSTTFHYIACSDNGTIPAIFQYTPSMADYFLEFIYHNTVKPPKLEPP